MQIDVKISLESSWLLNTVISTNTKKLNYDKYLSITSAAPRELLEPVYWFGCPNKLAQKYSSTLPKSFFFYKTDKLIYFVLSSVKVGHLRRLPLNKVFHKKYTTAI